MVFEDCQPLISVGATAIIVVIVLLNFSKFLFSHKLSLRIILILFNAYFTVLYSYHLLLCIR